MNSNRNMKEDCMSSLAELLTKVDLIQNDEEFIQEEHAFVRDYCIQHQFQLQEDDMNTIISRGFQDWFNDWKNDYEAVN
jgi:hypothetical protein